MRDVFLWFCHFSICCQEPGVVLDCIKSMIFAFFFYIGTIKMHLSPLFSAIVQAKLTNKKLPQQGYSIRHIGDSLVVSLSTYLISSIR